VLINNQQERFMARYHAQADLAPRDVVARSIDHEMKLSGDPCAFLDLRHLDRAMVEGRFPNLVRTCARFGIDLAGQPVPVVPAAHYMCGGVTTDGDARTSLTGLYAIGEVACTGIHGANRLASNSLLEAVYFAARAAAAVAGEPDLSRAARVQVPGRRGGRQAVTHQSRTMVLEHDWDQVRRIMWDYVGIVRDRDRLEIALERLRTIRQTVEVIYRESVVNPEVVELRNIALIGELIVLCARSREESRGLHSTTDFPKKSGRIANTELRRGDTLAGEHSWEPEPGSAGRV
jgi:L-aspartate oxidase